MRGNISAHDGTSPDYGPFTDRHVRQDHTVRPYEDILLNHNFSIADRSSRTRVKVRNDRSSEADNATIANRYVFRMCFVKIDKLTDEHFFTDARSAQPMQPRSHAVPARCNEGKFAGKSSEQNWQSQCFLPLPLVLTDRPVFCGDSPLCSKPWLNPSTAGCFHYAALPTPRS